MTPISRILLIADVRNEQARHIGDEAMLEANFDSLRRIFPDADLTIVARDPEWAARRYGVAALPTIDAAGSFDAVIVSGGGNLSSTWPDLLHERVALLELAHRFGKPAVVLGQTIGPHLSDDERELLAASLRHARFLGVRELPSAMLALGLGIPRERIWYQFDDALRVDEPVMVAANAATIAVTIDPQVRANGLFDSLADQLRRLADATGAQLVLIPHAFGGEAAGTPSDLTEARLLAEKTGASIAEGLDAEETRRTTAAASLVISTRYHPIVFGLISGVPSLGIYGDDYCRIKLQGALAHAGLERWAVTYGEVASGALLSTSLELWAMRERVRNDLAARSAAWRAEYRARWTAVRSALMGESAPISSSTLFGRPVDEIVPALASAFSAQRRWSEAVLASREARHEPGLRRRLRNFFQRLGG